MVEQVGSGIGRMKDLMIEADLTEPELNTEGIFTVTVRRPFNFNRWVDKWVDNLTDNNLDTLKDLGLIERIGSAKGGHYKLP